MTILAASTSPTEERFQRVLYIIRFIGDWMIALAGALIILSFVYSAFLWVIAGDSRKMTEKAKKQFVATCIVTAVIGGFFIFKDLAVELALNGTTKK